MSDWTVRHQGSPTAVPVPGPQRVLEGLRDGDWEPEDEVRGPGERDYAAIENHPLFAEAAAELEPQPAAHPDETHLDMNPLIDVALVLLIFFILTTSYNNLKRAIELPPAPDENKAATNVLKPKDIQDRVFNVKMMMSGGKPIIEIEGRGGVTIDELDRQIAETVKNTGRKEMFADVKGDVPWGNEIKLMDAAKAAGVTQIYWPRKPQ